MRHQRLTKCPQTEASKKDPHRVWWTPQKDKILAHCEAQRLIVRHADQLAIVDLIIMLYTFISGRFERVRDLVGVKHSVVGDCEGSRGSWGTPAKLIICKRDT